MNVLKIIYNDEIQFYHQGPFHWLEHIEFRFQPRPKIENRKYYFDIVLKIKIKQLKSFIKIQVITVYYSKTNIIDLKIFLWKKRRLRHRNIFKFLKKIKKFEYIYIYLRYKSLQLSTRTPFSNVSYLIRD